MNIKEHMKDNDDAKKILLAVIKMNLAKYISGQQLMNKSLSKVKLPIKKAKKGKKCILCLLSKLFVKMGECQTVVNEGIKTFKIVFDEDLNLSELIDEVSAEHFNGNAVNAAPKFGGEVSIPDDAPQEVRNILDEIIGKMAEKGLGAKMKVEVIDIKGNNYGLRPEHFKSFGEFCEAVSAAREAEASGKTGEEILTDAIIHNAEAQAEEPTPKEKLN